MDKNELSKMAKEAFLKFTQLKHEIENLGYDNEGYAHPGIEQRTLIDIDKVTSLMYEAEEYLISATKALTR